MANTWFIADTHFYHSNVIKYENRPFVNVNDMNETLIKNWNSKVKKNDRIFMLGDFALTNKDNIKATVEKLNGYKILIMGNHDDYSPMVYIEAGFSEVCKYPIILDNFFILSHRPIYINENMPYVNIFGHVHGNPAYNDYSKQSICVSVERSHINYYPIDYNKVKKLIGEIE